MNDTRKKIIKIIISLKNILINKIYNYNIIKVKLRI